MRIFDSIRKSKYFFLGIISLGGFEMFFWYSFFSGGSVLASLPPIQPSRAAEVQSSFFDDFGTKTTIIETNYMDESSSPFWWLSSGGELITSEGVGKTVQGRLGKIVRRPANAMLSMDIEAGFRPQNIFRLITRHSWKDSREEVYFKINKVNQTESPNRNISNGVYLINHYQGEGDVYYLGLQVDGSVVIKKKKNDTFSLIDIKSFYSADAPYRRDTNPNILPGNQWIGMRSILRMMSDGLHLALYIDKTGSGDWVLAAEGIDNGKKGGILKDGYGGIRTDFMDVEFDNFKITAL